MTNLSPEITFTVNLAPTMNLTVGPLTNEKTVGVLPGSDSNQSNVVSALLPTLQISPDYQLKHGDTFTAYGQKAIYLRNMYAVGYAPADRAYLEVVE